MGLWIGWYLFTGIIIASYSKEMGTFWQNVMIVFLWPVVVLLYLFGIYVEWKDRTK